MDYRYVAGHVDVQGDQLVAYGDVIADPDQRLIDNGFVIPVVEEAPAEPEAPAPAAPEAPVEAPATTDDVKEPAADEAGN